MNTSRIVLLGAGALLVAVLLLAAVVAFVPLDSSFDSGESDGSGFREAELANFAVTEPYCGDPNRRSGSSLATPNRGRGETIVVNDTMRVAGPDSDVAAFVDTWGPRRHRLKLEREPGNATGDCDDEVGTTRARRSRRTTTRCS